jgi:hypothetical protein
MCQHLLRLAFGPQFSPAVLEGTNQFALFGVHRDRRLTRPELLLDCTVSEFGGYL